MERIIMDRKTAISLATLALLEAGCSSSDKRALTTTSHPASFGWSTVAVKFRAEALALSILLFNAGFRSDFLKDDPNHPSQGSSASHPFKKIDPGVYQRMLQYFSAKGSAAATVEIQQVSTPMTNWANAALGGTIYDNPDECPCMTGDYNALDCEVVDPLLLP
jgi:hypothetical protein